MKKIGLKTLFSFLVIGSVMLLSGCTIFKSTEQAYKINLEIWGPIDDSQVFEKIVEKYKEFNPYIGDIVYRKFVYDDYKKDVIDALASGQGPDIFLIDNNWTPYFKNKIEPAPDYLLNETQVKNDFVDVVSKDFVADGKIYALPLSVDSLALYCNKDIFNSRGLTSFPNTWEEVEEDVKKITRIDTTGNIVQSGIALGTAYNINRSTDILSLMMIQNQTQMTSAEGNMATFNVPSYVNGETVRSGEKSLNSYTQFADSTSPFYTWNPRMHYSVDAFSEGNLAMMLNYSWQISAVRSKNSKLNFTVVPVPQFQGKSPVDMAYYMGLAVTKNKMLPADSQASNVQYNQLRIHESWQFIKFLTLKNNGTITLINGNSGNSKDFPLSFDPASEYLAATKRPAARKDLIEKQKTDPQLSSFAYGNLIATSWYQVDPQAISGVLAEMIDSINRGTATAYNALEVSARRITQLMTPSVN